MRRCKLRGGPLAMLGLATTLTLLCLLYSAYSQDDFDYDLDPDSSVLVHTVLRQKNLMGGVNLPLKPTARRPVDPSLVCHTFHCGRLGNTLFEYASVMGIANTTNKTPFFTNPQVLQGVLKHPPRRRHDHEKLTARCQSAVQLTEEQGGQYDRGLIQLEPGVDYQVGRCLQSWMYFAGSRAVVREAVSFRDDVVVNASRVTARLRHLMPGSPLVGMHVRRGDMVTNKKWVKQGFRTAGPEYLNRTMEFFRRTVPGAMFVVLGDDPRWCARVLRPVNDDVVILKPGSAEGDMQILSQMDHLVMSVGSFGWWAAFKNERSNPIVVYLRDFTRPGSSLSRWFRQDALDYMLPEWLPM